MTNGWEDDDTSNINTTTLVPGKLRGFRLFKLRQTSRAEWLLKWQPGKAFPPKVFLESNSYYHPWESAEATATCAEPNVRRYKVVSPEGNDISERLEKCGCFRIERDGNGSIRHIEAAKGVTITMLDCNDPGIHQVFFQGKAYQIQRPTAQTYEYEFEHRCGLRIPKPAQASWNDEVWWSSDEDITSYVFKPMSFSYETTSVETIIVQSELEADIHSSPKFDCTCGLYAANCIEELMTEDWGLGRWWMSQLPSNNGSDFSWPWASEPIKFLGIVEAWGKVIIGSRGFRAEKMKLVALALPENYRQMVHVPEGVKLYADGDQMLDDYPPISTENV